MSPSINRGRLTVDLGGEWRIYTPAALPGAVVLGIVTRSNSTGALMRIKRTGAYVQVNAGVARKLDGRKVAAALGAFGRPSEMKDGKRVNVYLDAESERRARELGRGNMSAGIREALARRTELSSNP